jgi:hypothetical protein
MLVTRLSVQGVPVIMLTGSPEFFPVPLAAGTTILEKPVSEAALLAHLGALIAKKAAVRDVPRSHRAMMPVTGCNRVWPVVA